MPVVGIDAEIGRRRWHELPQTDCANVAAGARVVGTLNFNVRLIEQPPFGHADVRAAQSRMARVAKGGLVDGIQDRWPGGDGARGDSSHAERTVLFLGCIPVTAE